MYLQGFGNHHQTEAIKDALPLRQNSPQHIAHGLYAEQLSGTSFTRERHQNSHSWLYRIQPSVVQSDYILYDQQIIKPFLNLQAPNPLRWSPSVTLDKPKMNFLESLQHIAGNSLLNTYLYHCNLDMNDCCFTDYDGELLFVPYSGQASLQTEFGYLELPVGHIAVIPRGIKFKFLVNNTRCEGYVCENSGNPLTLPSLGVMGANALANSRHFQYPTAAFEDLSVQTTIVCKSQQSLWTAMCDHSPLNVVAWHGNYAPYRYDLSLFNTINTVSFDHPDPSIFTVLSSESTTPGVANLDFVIFPPRWMVAEHSFRPPYFHRNYMNELMGLIQGQYDAKQEGFLPGGISIHNRMTAHGPDHSTYVAATQKALVPEFYNNNLAFMFESNDYWMVTEDAFYSVTRQKDYSSCWNNLRSNFK